MRGDVETDGPKEEPVTDLAARLDAVEARQRAYKMHDPTCPAFVAPGPSLGGFGAVLGSMVARDCDCWLAAPGSLCPGCGHAWRWHVEGHCLRDVELLGEGRARLACLCTEVRPEPAEVSE